MIKLYICCLVLIIGSVKVGSDMDIKFHQEVMEIVSYDNVSNRNKSSLLPFGGLFSFLFGTASEDDLNSIKADVKQLYQNQMDQTNVLNDIISITNVSRGLINENIKKINGIIDTIINLNQTIKNIAGQLGPLYTTRKFMFMHTE